MTCINKGLSELTDTKLVKEKKSRNIYVTQCDYNCLSETFKHKRMDVFWKLFHFHNITSGGCAMCKLNHNFTLYYFGLIADPYF